MTHNSGHETQKGSSHSDQTESFHRRALSAICCHPELSSAIRSIPDQCRHHRRSTTGYRSVHERLAGQHSLELRPTTRECPCQSVLEAVGGMRYANFWLWHKANSCLNCSVYLHTVTNQKNNNKRKQINPQSLLVYVSFFAWRRN